jgi:hypothetical protein
MFIIENSGIYTMFYFSMIIFFWANPNAQYIFTRQLEIIKRNFFKLLTRYQLIKEHPVLTDSDSDSDTKDHPNEIKEVDMKKFDPKFEDKYLEKFKNFPNEYVFSETELALEKQKYEEFVNEFETKKQNELNEIDAQLMALPICTGDRRVVVVPSPNCDSRL